MQLSGIHMISVSVTITPTRLSQMRVPKMTKNGLNVHLGILTDSKKMQKWTHSKRCVRDRGATVGSPALPSTSHRLPPCTAPQHRDDYSPGASAPIRSGWQHSLCTAQAVFPLCLRRKGIRPPIVGRAPFLPESTGKPRSLIG